MYLEADRAEGPPSDGRRWGWCWSWVAVGNRHTNGPIWLSSATKTWPGWRTAVVTKDGKSIQSRMTTAQSTTSCGLFSRLLELVLLWLHEKHQTPSPDRGCDVASLKGRRRARLKGWWLWGLWTTRSKDEHEKTCLQVNMHSNRTRSSTTGE